ncbi:hypothetical protein CEP52_004473 [Fusarium oligoseptatum]|uniref:Zn(2)-C6 fungal-type domain-containing protein n=1 Tax=Fusarium oligoseptatum TaxID=2604345 RepID=A0A428U3D7_9HYPO|nr:hypothetical protein CEP52_004473 [Fusarium oligoseptatum]
MTASVQVIEKASHTCTRCRVRKQRCDRLLPGCSRCTLKLVRCDYSLPLNGHSCTELNGSLVEFGTCGWDLSPFGQRELMKLAINDPVDQHSSIGSRLLERLGNILSEVNVTLSSLVEDYTRSIHNWFPIVNLDQFRPHINNPSTTNTETSTTLLYLVMLLVITPPCGHIEHLRQKRLYMTLQCLCAALQSQNDIGIPLVQAKSLIALYECGHGMTRQAYLTLSSTVAMMSLLEADSRGPKDEMGLKVCLIILDRLITLSTLNDNLPPASSSLSAGLRTHINAPSMESSPLDLISQKVRSMGKVALLAGRALDYMQGPKMDIGTRENSNLIDSDLENMLDHLLSQDSYSESYCDPTTMALCCLFIIRQERVRELNAQPGSKEYLALQACRRMVWDTCRESLESNKGADITRLSYISIFCVFYCVSALADQAESYPTCDEIDRLVPTLRMFAQKWTVGCR